MTRNRRLAIGCGIAAFVTPVIATCVCCALVIRFLERDQPDYSDYPEPPDDSDLLIEPLDLPDDKNAYLYYVRAAQSVYWTAEQDEKVRRLHDGDEWDPEFAEVFLAQNAKAWELYQQGLACEQAQAPVDYPGDKKFALAKHQWSGFEVLVVTRLRWLIECGEQEAAFDEVFDLIEYGDSLKSARARIHYYLHGAKLQAIALGMLRDCLPDARLPSAQLVAYAHRLEPYKHDQAALAAVLKAEYTGVFRLLPQGFESVPNPQLNRARTLFAESTREAIENAERPCEEIDLPERTMFEDSGKTEMAVIAAVGRAEGAPVSEIQLKSNSGLLRSNCTWRSNMSVAQAFLALKAYELDTGSLPDSLDELVPDYLDEVPLDYSDGNPIRYSPAEKRVYSTCPPWQVDL